MAFKTTITICGRRVAERMLACGRMTQKVLKCQPGDLLEWTEDEANAVDHRPAGRAAQSAQ